MRHGAVPGLRTGLGLKESELPALLLVLLIDIGVGHAGNIVANDPGQRLSPCLFLVVAGKLLRMGHPKLKQVAHNPLCSLLLGL